MSGEVKSIIQGQLRAVATIVTRNRPGMLDKALGLLSNQSRPLQEILVVDNDSQPETREVVSSWQKRNPAVSYFNTKRNAGGAGGQKEALNYAVQHGHDLAWMMDDDCEPKTDAFEKIAAAWSRLDDRESWALNSMVMDVECPDKMSFGLLDGLELGVAKGRLLYFRVSEIPLSRIQNGLYVGYGCFFNGTLIPTSLIRKIGVPDEKLFIRGDEVEYHCRVLSKGKVATVLDSVVLHPKDGISGKDLPLWKTYYGTRNSVLISRQYFPSLKTTWFYLLARTVRYRMLALMGKMPAVNRTMALAVRDAMSGKFDRNAFALK